MKYRLAALLCFALLGACTPRPTLPPQGLPEGNASTRWSLFEQTASIQPMPSLLSGSLRFGPAQDTRRVTYLLWSNGEPPLRLDVQAGVGATAAKAQVKHNEVVLYAPQDKKAYRGVDAPDKALRSLGIPLPLSLEQLNAFLQGRYAAALNHPKPEGNRPAAQGQGIVYAIQMNGVASELELSPQGLPVRWKSGGAWDVAITYDKSGLPSRMDGVLPPGSFSGKNEEVRLVLLIKERQPHTPYSPRELEFELPQGTPLYNLE